MTDTVRYEWLPGGRWATEDVLRECSNLYSAHYGIWSRHSPHHPGDRIRLAPERLRNWLRSDDSRLALARANGQLVGYAIAVQTRVPDYGFVSWVTQLVVHEAYRNRRIGTSLLFSIWSFTDHFAWGLTTANPYAVRALEKATRRRCNPERIGRNRRKLLSTGAAHVHYIESDTALEVSRAGARINTRFFVDHSTLEEKLRQVVTPERTWTLGDLQEGWEWFAFTFQDQEPLKLARSEIDQMIKAADDVTRQAYARMALSDGGHKWAMHTTKEVGQIRECCNLAERAVVYDFGCGTGRHAIELATLGYIVTGVDYLERFIENARNAARERHLDNVRFVVGDCRSVALGADADAIVCLYDVVGTYGDTAENARIIENIARHLRVGGRALISVMNRDLTERIAKKRFSLADDPDALLRLAPSRTMEQTGNIFDPHHFIIDRDTGIVYRKEQFESRTALPAELVVRDKRFYVAEIAEICERSGLAVIWTRRVRAGAWEVSRDEGDEEGKEILVLCERR